MTNVAAFSRQPVLVFLLFILVTLATKSTAYDNQILTPPSKQTVILPNEYFTSNSQAAAPPDPSPIFKSLTEGSPVTSSPSSTSTSTPTTSPPDTPKCPPLLGDMDLLTTAQFATILTHECRYDKLGKPNTQGPINVDVQLDIKHIEAVEQLKFKVHMLIQFMYYDKRLAYKDISPKRDTMLGENALRNNIWTPHIIVTNDRESSIMGLEGNDMFISIDPKGKVIFSYRMMSTIYCWMDLKKFPFDEQTCDIILRSWTFNDSDLLLNWNKEEAVKVASQLHLTEFVLSSFSTYTKLTDPPLSNGAFIGNYSALVFKFVLSRQAGFYILDYYIPSILLVATSWVTFWIQADQAAPRVTLGTSTMLAFITLASGQSKNLPKVSYIKASEIWFLGCVVFIFLSMAEFSFVNIIWRRRKKVELKKVNSKYILKSTLTPRLARRQLEKSNSGNNLHKSHSCSSLENCNEFPSKGNNNANAYNNYLTVHSFPSSLKIPTITTQSDDDLINPDSQDNVTIPVPGGGHNQTTIQKWTSMTPQEVANWIDKRSRFLFPAAFIIFNIIYWSLVYAL